MKYFGTDGIRGVANTPPMTPDIALRVGQAAGQVFRKLTTHARPTVVIGKDTRLSGYMVESALQSGFTSMGFYCLLVGPLPTPAVAMLTRSLRADLGVMVTASHNPFVDNGIKIFGADGVKISDTIRDQIEVLLEKPKKIKLVAPDKIGKAVRLEDAIGRYTEFCKMSIPRALRLDGMRLVVDCAHGAAYKIAPKILWELGAQVVRLGCDPDGFNINQNCGATSVQGMCDAVRTHGADLGLALDGDADRLILCDEKGRVIDGDQILCALGLFMHQNGTLKGKGLVGTQMSNMGLEKHLEKEGLHLVRTPVGDHYVEKAMRDGGYNIGGESSGHLILGDYATTGDGILAALQFLNVMKASSVRASVLGQAFQPYPQRLENIALPDMSLSEKILSCALVQEKIDAAQLALNGYGRVLIRRSGTEPVVRVMVEGAEDNLVKTHVAAIAQSVEEAARGF